MPKSLGRENMVVRYGLEPYRSSDLEVSRAYKAPPHTRATDIIWCVRWESNPQSRRPQRRAYACSATNACLASPRGFEPLMLRIGGAAVSATRENLVPRVGFEPTVVGLEGRLPSFGRGFFWSGHREANPTAAS